MDTLNIWKTLDFPPLPPGFPPPGLQDHYIKDWDWIRLKFVNDYARTDNHYWVSCWGSGSTCKPRTCPGKLGSTKANACRGELFQIVNDKKEVIQNCQTIAIRYSYWSNRNQVTIKD